MDILKLAPTATRVVRDILALKKGERVLIITDPERPHSITQALAFAAVSCGAQPVVMIMPRLAIGGMEPPPEVAAAMKVSTAIINQSTISLTHTDATREALKAGARIANLRNLDEDMMLHGGVAADYEKVKDLSERIARILSKTETAELTTPEGTHLVMSLKGRPGFAQTGFATQPGQFSGLPDGEATIAPVEDTTEGVVVDPYLADDLGLIDRPFKFEVKRGRIVNIEGKTAAERLRRLIEEHGKDADRFASQLAIGTNDACRLTDNTREVTKKLGTCHLAIGDNKTLAGTVTTSMHMDIVFLNPTLLLDGKPILKDGRLLLEEFERDAEGSAPAQDLEVSKV
ncbi:MAG: aminopeptidase [Candidatus Fermentithermobacillus carboniphilus]|uniref:Aminopeptidase n=1 Tax=Candidatus Fermentithermobacillus carboniphilus TaxID=3085328 RepID=A0AAT9LBP8_9FIRM|nr:MAG: aminopeptidase [Candidatus Fermentithermobacillus carboniphilus]